MTNHTLPEIEIAKEETLRSNQREQLIAASINPYKHTFNRSHLIHNVIKLHQSIQAGESTNSSHTIAGRLIAKRGHGKALFGNIQDDSGTIQFYANINDIADHLFQQIEQFNIGDIIGIEGVAFCTRKGELSLRVANATLLTKSLHPLPEKFHGLQDKEKRYRQRYVDLIANPEVKKTFSTRSKTVSFIRNFLNESGFMEVETPILQSVYGGAEARPFNTHHNELKQNLFLRISLELPLKRLIVGGFENIFEIGRVFRNEGISYKHNPEYTLLELYQAYADYNDMMRLTETLLSELVLKITGSHQLNYKDQSLSFTPPFAKFTLHEALKHFANVDANNLLEMNKKAREVQPELPDSTPKIELIKLIYDNFVEPKLISPTFITNHPWETSPLAKRDRNNPELVERFELIIHGMEIANAYSELNDPIEQEHRFKEQESARDHGAKETHPMDQDFVTALKYGMPPTGGLGIGIDRVVMLLTNENSIRDVLFFPHLKT